LLSALTAGGIKVQPIVRVLPPGETESKNRATKETIEDWMLENK
jgi:hypothetical protein